MNEPGALGTRRAAVTFEEAYCEWHRCNAAQFRRRVFWRTLHRHTLAFASLLSLGDHFVADEYLIAACGRARTMEEIDEELADARRDPANLGFLRGRLELRISTRRLRHLAQEYLPDATSYVAPGPKM